jgi:hypothetical protein
MVNWILIIIGVVVLVLVIILVLFLLARSKGKIVINLQKYNFAPGETVTGSINLKLKKPVQAKSLKVGLLGRMHNTQYSRGGRSDRYQKAFEFKQPLDGEKTYPVGEKIYNFNIKIPKDILSSRYLQGALGSAIKAVQIISGNISSIKWYITSNLEMPGFDISKKVQINIG